MKRGMSASGQPNAYLKTRIMTASPAQLRGMLLDGAVRFARTGRDGLAEQDFEKAYNGIHRCQKILMELLEGLDPSVDRELCERLSSLYLFLYTQLMKATTERDPKVVDEVIRLLEFECETWRMLMERLAEDEQAPSAAASMPTAEPKASSTSTNTQAASMPGTTLSIQG